MAAKGFQVNGVAGLLKAVDGIEKGRRKVITRALNKTATGAKTDAVKLIRQHLTIKAKSVRDGLKVRKANWSTLTSMLVARGKRGVPLFGNYPVRPGRLGARKPKKGVSVQIKKRGSSKLIKGSFVARMKSGHVSVFKREKGVSRLPIKQLYGVGPIVFMQRGMIHRQLKRRINARLEKNLTHEINYLHQSNLKKIARLKG